MDFSESLGVLYMTYDSYASNCEKSGRKPAGFFNYIFSCLKGKALN